MSILLRQPLTVPALFSRAAEAEAPPAGASAGAWRRRLTAVPLVAGSGWLLLALVEVPLAKGAAALLDVALHR